MRRPLLCIGVFAGFQLLAAEQACNDTSAVSHPSQNGPQRFEQSEAVQHFFQWDRLVEEAARDTYLRNSLWALAFYPIYKLLKAMLVRFASSGTASYKAKMKDLHDLDVADPTPHALKVAKKAKDRKDKERAVEQKNQARNIALVLLKPPASTERLIHSFRDSLVAAGLELLDGQEGDIEHSKVKDWSSDTRAELVELGAFIDLAEIDNCAKEGNRIHYWIVSWSSARYDGSWLQAIHEMFGDANKATSTSIRGKLMTALKEVGAASGCLSVSPGAVEGLRTRQLCLHDVASDPFGQALAKAAAVDIRALEDWLRTGSLKRMVPKAAAPRVIDALGHAGSVVTWRRPGGTQAKAVAYGPLGADAILVPTGAQQPEDPACQALRAAAWNLAQSGSMRVFLVEGQEPELKDAVKWLSGKERFAQELPAEEIRGSRDGVPRVGEKVKARFGAEGAWLAAVVELVKKRPDAPLFMVRFFNDAEEERAFDEASEHAAHRKDSDSTRSTESGEAGSNSTSTEPEESASWKPEAEIVRVAVLGLNSSTSSLALSAACGMGCLVASCAVVGLESCNLPRSLASLSAPLQVHTAAGRLGAARLDLALHFGLRSARMPVKTFREAPRSLAGRLREALFPADDTDPSQGTLASAVTVERPVQRESHRYGSVALPGGEAPELLLRRCLRFARAGFRAAVPQLSEDERKERDSARVSVILPRFGRMLGPAAWRDPRLQAGGASPALTAFGADDRSPGLLDCPAMLMIGSSVLAVAKGVLSSVTMTREVFLMQALVSSEVDEAELMAMGWNLLKLSFLDWMLNIPKERLTRTGGEKVVLVLKENCFHALLRQDVAYADAETVEGMSALLHHHTGIISNFLSYKFPEMLSATSEFTGAISFLLYFCPHLLIHFLALAAFKIEAYSVIIWISRQSFSRRGLAREDWPKDRSGETLSNFRAVRAYNRQEEAEKDFAGLLQFHAQRGKKDFLNPMTLVWLMADLGFQYFDLFSKMYAGRLVTSGIIAMAISQELLNKGGQLLWRTWWFFEQLGIVTFPWHQEQESWLQAGAKLLVLFERIPKVSLEEGKWDASNIGDFRGEIEFRDITFRYPPKKPEDKPETIFEGLDLKIEGGTKVGLVGPSGGGKTTTLALIQRFYDPERGEVLLDGRPISEYKPSFLASVISVVQQDAAIFDMTVAENIRWGKADATPEEIEDALMKASLYHDLDRKPLRFDTPATELSGGQKQRLTIARAIVRKPKILLLDEATAALDTKSEKEVQRALNALMADCKGTCVAIAHRLSTIMDSHCIAVIKKKRVVEKGSHQELVLKEGGEYAELSKLAGMAGAEGEMPKESALREAVKMLRTEQERDPGSTFLPQLLQKLKAAQSWTDAERWHLKELSQTYERALQTLQDENMRALEERVEKAKEEHTWTPSLGEKFGRFELLPRVKAKSRELIQTPPELRRQVSAASAASDDESLPLLSLQRAQSA